jgi:hypothetical protein
MSVESLILIGGIGNGESTIKIIGNSILLLKSQILAI